MTNFGKKMLSFFAVFFFVSFFVVGVAAAIDNAANDVMSMFINPNPSLSLVVVDVPNEPNVLTVLIDTVCCCLLV